MIETAQSVTMPAYGGGRPLPVAAWLEDARADLGSGLLLRLHAAMIGLLDGQILAISSPVETLGSELREFETSSGHALLSVVDDSARPGWRIHYLRKGRARTAWGTPNDQVALDGAGSTIEAIAALMPRRLWLYTNYDCNLQCDYCCVVAGPRADPRRLSADRIRALAEQAADLELERIFLTGGEPMLRPDLPGLLRYITDRLPVTILTNAMLIRGGRWDGLRTLVEDGCPISFQVSLDSADRTLHDEHRGRGAHARALDGIRTLLAAGAHVRLAATLTDTRLDEIPRLHALADGLGVLAVDRIFRPVALRGAAAAGEPIRLEDLAPELTCDAQGWFWHPLSNDPDMRLAVAPDAPLAQALDAVRARLVGLGAERAARLDRFVCG